MARLVLTAAGFVIGNIIAPGTGGQWGALLGSLAGAALEPPTKTKGPRLDDPSAPKLQYGTAWPRLYGRQRVAGIPLYASDKHATTTTTSQGKGGGGTETENTTYAIDVLFGVSIDTPIAGVSRVWINKKLVYSVGPGTTISSRTGSQQSGVWQDLELFDGNAAQVPWDVYEADVGVGNAPAYRHRSTIGITGLALGNTGQMHLVEFEVFTSGVPATQGYVDNFTDGLAAFTEETVGDYLYFSGESGIYYSYIQADGNTGFGDTAIEKTFTTVDASGFSIIFQMLTTADDDNGPMSVRSGSTNRFSVIGRRETAFDATRRPFVGVAAESIPLHSAQLSNYVWYEVRIQLVAGAGNSYAELYNADTETLISTVFFSGNYTSLTCDKVRIENQTGDTSGTIRYSRLRVGGDAAVINDVDIDDIVTAECARVGLTAGQIDVTGLAGLTCTGYGTAQGARASLEQLAADRYFEVFTDDKLRFVLRGGASAVTVAYADTGVAVDSPGDPFNGLDRADELAVPAFHAFTFPDLTRDYESGTVMSDRLVGQSSEVRQLQSSVVMTPSEAKGRVDTYTADARVASHTGVVTLGLDHIQRTPTDLITLTDVDGTTYRTRLVRMTFADFVFGCEVVLDDATVLQSSGIAPADGEPAITVEEAGATVLTLVDAPILRDADDDNGMYGAALVHGTGQGSRIYKSPDDVTFTPVIDVTEDAVGGSATTALGSFTGGYVYDEVNTVTVVLVPGGTLASSTRDAMQADRQINVAGLQLASGEWEVFRYRTATLVGTNQYTLSGLLRGLQGTEAYIAGHAVGERFVSLRMTGLRRLPMETSEIGVERFWKGVTLGQDTTSVASQAFTHNAVGRRPYSPTSLRAFRTTGNDIELTWMRRTRLETRFGGSGGSVSPLGEETEAYEIDVFADGSYATLKRTLSAAAEAVTYTSAQQTTDFGSAQATIYTRAYQLSAVVGRGSKLQAAV
jgi:hypothetical protein